MKNDVIVQENVVIPAGELTFTTSRSGGAGGQHVNKTESRVTLRWNVKETSVLDDAQKELIIKNLQGRLTEDGDLLIHASASRSQLKNKEEALARFVVIVRKALSIPKKRMKTKVSKAVKEARLQKKSYRSTIKKMRSKKFYDE